ncbi:enoyl-CoA hydratase/isomerase family protein [Corynebacterium poyangense]|uniref:3-hydroxyisobutyryl-CoA hydrolase n=1 Tax=Corynebacterium poyangense TaxID=2684405 RepID=A0A7H0SL72_9CORY|nr:enoyl-CoA hydratase/isomerase family protein [Corynebacterium poyangense]QNQ89297.1 enoyl-CoA hydratase/isomerase family protein [Corynebacterium poyangense]
MSEHVVITTEGKAGIITLNRPKALNALNLDMVKEMSVALKTWREDDDIALVIVRGAGERAFCAGGDIATLYQDVKDESVDAGLNSAEFFRNEYELNYLIATYPKPYVALMHGIVLGGGVGVSAHGSHRVVTDSTRLGMPEVGIGFAPDVGGTFLLARSADRLGRHLAYTSLHVAAAEAIDLGFADYYVPEDQLEALTEALIFSGNAAVIERFSREIGPGFGDDRAEMVQVYSAASPEETLLRLDSLARAHGPEHWAAKAAKKIRTHSPLGIKTTRYALDKAEHQDLAEALSTEFWTSMNLMLEGEFVEGVRAQIIDKDRQPRWAYQSLEAVPEELAVRMLCPRTGSTFTPPQFS